MTTNENKTRFNMIDFIIIMVVIACVIGTVFRSAILDRLSFSSSADSARISFCAENLTEDEIAMLKAGDTLTLSEKEFGVVKSLTKNAQIVIVKSDDGSEFVEAVDNMHYTLTGEIEISGDNTEKGFFFDSDIHIGVGKVLNLKSQNCDISIVITKIIENEG